MNKEDIQTLFAYNAWANERIMQAAAKVAAEQMDMPAGLSHTSLRGTLLHLVGVEYVWRQRTVLGVSPTTLLGDADLPTFEALDRRRVEEDQKWIAYAASASDVDLQQVVHYKNTKGEPFANPLWQILVHVVNHGTQTRSEAGVALTGYNSSPGDIDLIKFLRER